MNQNWLLPFFSKWFAGLVLAFWTFLFVLHNGWWQILHASLLFAWSLVLLVPLNCVVKLLLHVLRITSMNKHSLLKNPKPNHNFPFTYLFEQKERKHICLGTFAVLFTITLSHVFVPVVCFHFSLSCFQCLQRQQFFLGALSVWWVGMDYYCPNVLFPNLKGLFLLVACFS